MALKVEEGKAKGLCFLRVQDTNVSPVCASPNHSVYLTPTFQPDEAENPSSSDSEDDYFEEFYSPLSRINTPARYKSFRKEAILNFHYATPGPGRTKTPLRTGDFQRLGSNCRKAAEDQAAAAIPEDGVKEEDRSSSDSDQKGMGYMLDDTDTTAEDISLNIAETRLSEEGPPVSVRPFMLRSNTSTPKPASAKYKHYSIPELSMSAAEESVHNESNEANLSIEQSTLTKVRECFDSTKFMKYYHLCDTLQDILTPKKGEAISVSSHWHRNIFSEEIMDAVDNNSSQEHLNLNNVSGGNGSNGNADSGISSPKRISIEGADDLGNTDQSEVAAVLLDGTSEPGHEREVISSKRSPEILLYVDPEDEDTGFRFESHSAHCIAREDPRELGAEGLFVESKTEDIGLKKIAAPEFNLTGGSNEGFSSKRLSDTFQHPELLDKTAGFRYQRNWSLRFEEFSSKRSSDIFLHPDLGDEDAGLRYERHSSLRLTKEDLKELGVEGVFVESKAQDIGLKKIAAPELELSDGSREEFSFEIPDLSIVETNDPACFQDAGTSGANSSEISQCQAIPVSLSDTLISNEGGEPDQSRNEQCVSELMSEVSRVLEVTATNLDSEGEAPSSLNLGNSSSCRGDGEDGADDISIPAIGARLKHHKIYPVLEPLPSPPDQFIAEFSAGEERHWRNVVIGGVWRRIDMTAIEPYRKCVNHGGYLVEKQQAVIVFCACHLPVKSVRNYGYIMDNLFIYVLSTLEQLVVEDYVLVYLAGGAQSSHMPTLQWLRKAYQMIARKLRKNLKALYVVHPTFWVKTVVKFSRLFISDKFYRKLSFVSNLAELARKVPLGNLQIPDVVRQVDFELMIKEKKKNKSKSC
ncbi:protein prune homolog 2-like [Macrobrachium nipponense]|uniref:protein prune homolog 2-like n=1 Tax=Macrobrachium nipponense TaxID=159736 RepID=UPI0030C8A634